MQKCKGFVLLVVPHDPERGGEPKDSVVYSRCGEAPCVCEKRESEPCVNCGERSCICPKEPPADYKKKIKDTNLLCDDLFIGYF